MLYSSIIRSVLLLGLCCGSVAYGDVSSKNASAALSDTVASANTLAQHITTANRNAKKLTKSIRPLVRKQKKRLAMVFHANRSTRSSSPEPLKLYYFISFSMPTALIKRYMLDAIWTGGVLVLRGAEPGMTLMQFIHRKLLPLVKYKGNHARISINPNLFEEYRITHVPTIVIAKGGSPARGCHMQLHHLTKQLVYQRCAPVKSDSYWLISGAVSSYFALQHLASAGAPATLFLVRLSQLTENHTRQAVPFTGHWSSAPMPYGEASVLALLSRYGLAQTQQGELGSQSLINQIHQLHTRDDGSVKGVQ